MSDGVDIPLESMDQLNQALKAIVVEFDEAGSRTGSLLEAIGRPFGRGELRDEADDFEGRWDDKRETLRGHLVKLQEQVEGVRDGWADFDRELAAQMEPEE
ncbi:hypothetical protein [Microbacterium sp.]|uniref:hypothetical protein n=1 Tax=Microbacterium sp. TaxID=51671 RepID=UPI0035B0CE2F